MLTVRLAPTEGLFGRVLFSGNTKPNPKWGGLNSEGRRGDPKGNTSHS